jgi:FkbM family methyltransferase
MGRYATLKVVCANPPDYPEMIAWRKTLRPGDLFVDVGANVGTYTIWAGDLGARVIALEPAADTYDLLAENVALNSHPAQMIQAAAGATCGVTAFTVGQDDVNHMDPFGKAQARMVTIDSVLGERIAAGMKIDVEGFELEVLRGCKRALAEHRIRVLQIEWNGTSREAIGSDRRPIANMLAEYGYILYRPDRDGILVPLTDLGFGSDVFAQPG